MGRDWKLFWSKHGKFASLLHPQQQVLRTIDKSPVSAEQFQDILLDIDKKFNMLEDDVILDLCCGNGLITRHLASKCGHVVGVDFTLELITRLVEQKRQNIETVVADVRDVDFNEGSFDKVIIYAGLQYLSPGETINLFESVIRWLRGNGLFFVGDIPDRAKLWDFFNTDDGRRAHFDATKRGKPLVGTWFESDWLTRLGEWVGFDESEILEQPNSLPYSHYRFDMTFRGKNV